MEEKTVIGLMMVPNQGIPNQKMRPVAWSRFQFEFEISLSKLSFFFWPQEGGLFFVTCTTRLDQSAVSKVTYM